MARFGLTDVKYGADQAASMRKATKDTNQAVAGGGLKDWTQLLSQANTLRSAIPSSYYKGGYKPPGAASEQDYQAAVGAYNKAVTGAQQAFAEYTKPETISWEPYSQKLTNESNQFLSRINQISIGDFDFSTTPVAFNPVTALQVDTIAEANKAFRNTQQMVGEYDALAKEITSIDLQNREAQLDEFVPGWRDSTNKVKAINDYYLRGEIPRDVANQLTRSAAYITSMGGGGARNQAALTARDLGLASTQLQQTGIAGTQSYMSMMAGLMPKATSVMDIIATQGVTSEQAINTAIKNAENKLMANYYTSTGELEASIKSQELRLRGQEAASTRGIGLAQIQAAGYGKALDVGVANIVAGYTAEQNTAAEQKAWRDQLANLQIAQNPKGFSLWQQI